MKAKISAPNPEHYNKCVVVMCEECQQPRLDEVNDLLPVGFRIRYQRARIHWIEGVRILKEHMEKYEAVKNAGVTGKPLQLANLTLGYLNSSLVVAKTNYYNHAREALFEVRKKREPSLERTSSKRQRFSPGCDICYEEEVDDKRALQCGHCFCSSCCDGIMNTPHPTCPHCRARVVLLIDLKNMSEL